MRNTAWLWLLLALSLPAGAQAAPPPSCQTAPVTAFKAQLGDVSTGVLSAPPVIPDGGVSGVGILGPLETAAHGEPQFRAFLASKRPYIAMFDQDTRGLTSADRSSGAAAPASAAWPANFEFPSEANEQLSLAPWSQDELLVVACDGPRFVGFAAHAVSVSLASRCRVLAILAILVAYLGCALVVYRTRRSAAQNQDDEARPYRLARVTPWTFVECLNPVNLTADVYDRGNLPKLQIFGFTLLVAYGVAFIVLRTGHAVELSPTLVGLLGIPALGTLGAQAVANNTERLSSTNWAWLVERRVLPVNDPGADGRPMWRDLIATDGDLDLYKVQAAVFSLFVAAIIVTTGFSDMSGFSLPSSWLEILGLSQAVFVGGRIVKPATMGDVDKLITELKKRDAALRRAASTGVDVDADGNPGTQPTAANPPIRSLDLALRTDGVPVAATRYLRAAKEVEVLLTAMAHRAIKADLLTAPNLALGD